MVELQVTFPDALNVYMHIIAYHIPKYYVSKLFFFFFFFFFPMIKMLVLSSCFPIVGLANLHNVRTIRVNIHRLFIILKTIFCNLIFN